MLHRAQNMKGHCLGMVSPRVLEVSLHNTHVLHRYLDTLTVMHTFAHTGTQTHVQIYSIHTRVHKSTRNMSTHVAYTHEHT